MFDDKTWSAHHLDSNLLSLMRICNQNPLRGKVLKAVYNGNRPSLVHTGDPSRPGGATVDIFEILSEKMGFTTEYKLLPFGYVDPKTMQWQGRTRAVRRKLSKK